MKVHATIVENRAFEAGIVKVQGKCESKLTRADIEVPLCIALGL